MNFEHPLDPAGVNQEEKGVSMFHRAKTIQVLLLVFSVSLFLWHGTSEAMEWSLFTEELKKVDLGVSSQLRYELWGALQKAPPPDTQPQYGFFNLRIRPYVKYPGKHIVVFFQFQYAGGFFLPEAASSGPGKLYYVNSDKDANPQAVDVLELYLQGNDIFTKGLGFRVGRYGIKDGLEVLYKDKAFNWIKKTRLSERLIGTFDWTNVGRRYDAARASYNHDRFYVEGFASRLLAGGFNYDTAFDALETVNIYGGTLTLKKDGLIPNTEVRLFGYYYYDNRPPTEKLTGGRLGIPTTGLSLVGVYPVGPGALDLLLWGCYQWGDWGTALHEAHGAVGEIGYQLTGLGWKPWFRAGFAYASGDEDPSGGAHKSFFGMAPTNHKFYGYADTTAYSNLLNPYIQLILKPLDKFVVQTDGHVFWLAEENDAWYGGSGPINDTVFGYAARNTQQEGFIGGEIDVTMKYTFSQHFNLVAGYSHFFGASGAKKVFTDRWNVDFFYLQTVVKF